MWLRCRSPHRHEPPWSTVNRRDSTSARRSPIAPPGSEMCAQVWASSEAALASGDFRLVVSGISRTGTALAGRFIDLLPEPDQDHRHAVYGALPVGVQGALAAQLSF